ncbi:MAG: hypothetical protein ACPGUU_00970 [Flavobacteriaceae bacterium]
MKIPIVLLFTLLISSCKTKTDLEKDFNCSTPTVSKLETVKDMKSIFSLQLPKHWKTNLFYDSLQSSIYTADTTRQLTETTILDITLIQDSIALNQDLKLKFEQAQLQKKLIVTKSKNINLINKPSYYFLSKGNKNNYPYQSLDVYILMNESNFILAKAEVYGDSLVNQRLCEAINLIEKIKLQ